jgi:hypothetical protein
VQTKELYHLILGIFMAQRMNCFLGIYATFHFVWSQILRIFIIVVLNILRNFNRISMIISTIPVMIGHVRLIRHMYRFAVPTYEEFLKVSII